MRQTTLCLALCAALGPAAVQADAGRLDQWKEYAGASIAPDFDWYRPASVAPPSVRPQQADSQSAAFWSTRGLALRLSALDSDWAWASADASAVPRSNAFVLDGRLSGRAVSAQF